MLDSNTSAEIEHDLAGEKRELEVQYHREKIKKRASEIVLKRIALASDLAKEAVGGEDWSDGDYAVIAGIMSCIVNSHNRTQKEDMRATLGDYIFNKFFEYLLTDSVKEQAEEEVLSEAA